MRRDTLDWSKKDSRTNWLVNRGYTGHEHLDAFGIINMNGRVYDPLTAMFFSPDPYVQAPDNWLNYNRYGYGYGNPFKYTDPSGEIFGIDDIIAAAFIGYIINITTQGLSGKINSLGDYCKAAFIGGITGIAGAAGGAWAGSVCKIGGFWGGAAVGASGGFAGGFVGGASNVWMNGGSFGDGLQAGFVGGLIGGAAGGLIGGVVNGISDARNSGNFWTGDGAIQNMTVQGNSTQPVGIGEIKVEDGMQYSTEYAKKFSDLNDNNGLSKAVNQLRADGSVPPTAKFGIQYSKVGDHVFYGGEEVFGSTQGQNVYLYKLSFTSKEQLSLTMHHEYMHANFNALNLKDFSQYCMMNEGRVAYESKSDPVSFVLFIYSRMCERCF